MILRISIYSITLFFLTIKLFQNILGSKTVADLKGKFPGLQKNIKSAITSEMQRAIRDET